MSASPKSKNSVHLAVAGAGKTTKIVRDVLAKQPTRRIAIITYTNKAVASIVDKFHTHNSGVIPSKVDVFTWYNFLYNECILPYQKSMFPQARMRGITFEGFYGAPNFKKKADIDRYVSKDGRLKAKHASEFMVECLNKERNAIRRLAEIYEEIIIDEIQDLVGEDLDFIETFIEENGIKLTLVGDSRQSTFTTHTSTRNKKFKGVNIVAYFQMLAKGDLISLCEMNDCYRSNQDICTFADMAFPNLAKAVSKMDEVTGHDGVFLIKKEDGDAYLRWMREQGMNWQCLKYDAKTKTTHSTMNFGECKGLTFERVVIFPNNPLQGYLTNFTIESPAKYYVGLTRARYSVAIVVDKFPVCAHFKQESITVEGSGIVVMKFSTR